MTRLVSNLPETTNGLDAIADELVKAPREERIVVAIVDCKDAKLDFDNSRTIPYARIRAIEPLTGEAASQARKLLEGAYIARTGQDSLTLDEVMHGDPHDHDGKPCPVWHAMEGEDDMQPCVYEDGHDGPHRLRDGTEWDDDEDPDEADAKSTGPAFQEPEPAND